MIRKIQYLRKLIPIGMPTGFGTVTIGGQHVSLNPNTVIDPTTGFPVVQTLAPTPPTPTPPAPTPPTPTPPTPPAPTPSNPPPIIVDLSINVFDPIVNLFSTNFKSAGSYTIANLPPLCTDANKTSALNACQLAFENQNTKILSATNLTQAVKPSALTTLMNQRTAAFGQIRDIQTNNNRYINGIIAANQTAIEARRLRAIADAAAIAQQIAENAILAEKTALFNLIVQYGETISKLDTQHPPTKGRNLVNGLNYISNNKSVHVRDGAGNIIVTKE